MSPSRLIALAILIALLLLFSRYKCTTDRMRRILLPVASIGGKAVGEVLETCQRRLWFNTIARVVSRPSFSFRLSFKNFGYVAVVPLFEFVAVVCNQPKDSGIASADNGENNFSSYQIYALM